MSTEQEHEIVPAIRDWLAATSSAEIPPGLSREKACGRAREILVAIQAGSAIPDEIGMDDDLKDVLWASVEELDEKPLGQPTFKECDRFYQFAGSLHLDNDVFDERDEILRQVARIGWRSAPGGPEAVEKARDAIWQHGDERQHVEICESAGKLGIRIAALGDKGKSSFEEIGEICARLLTLANVRPSLVMPPASALAALMDNPTHGVGCLDDREYLKASIALVAGIAARQLGCWELARSGYALADSAFRRTANARDLDRVEAERLSFAHQRQDNTDVVQSAPDMIRRLVIPRERVKVQLLFASALLGLDQPLKAREVLMATRSDPVMDAEPAFRVWLLTKLGTAFSYLGRETEAMESFSSAGDVAARFHHPVQLANLASSIGEHLARFGKIEQAIVLYKRAREISRELSQRSQDGYLSVLLAELLMFLGRNEEAEAELIAALPLIERFDLRREAVAAVALLRETLTKRRTDLTAIRELCEQLRRGLP